MSKSYRRNCDSSRTEDVEAVCDMLGLHRVALEELLSNSSHTQENFFENNSESLKGKTVYFTGEMVARINGVEITRKLAEEFATRAGLVAKNGVTRKLDILVCVDALSQSGKQKKHLSMARELCLN